MNNELKSIDIFPVKKTERFIPPKLIRKIKITL